MAVPPVRSDPYAALGVSKTCTDAELRKAYLRLAQKHHPDRHGTGERDERSRHEKRMLEINDAWSMLDSPAKRRAHDRGETDAHRSTARSARSAEPPNHPPTGARRPDESGEQLRDWRSYAGAGSSGSTTGWQLLTFVPPGLALAAVGSFLLSLLLRTNLFMGVAVVLASLAVVSLLALALLRMTRGAQADNAADKRRSY